MKRVSRGVVVVLAMVSFVLLAGVLPSPRAFAQEVDSGETRPIVWLEDAGYFGGSTSDFVVVDNFLYLVAGATLEVVNVADGSNPSRVHFVTLPSVATAVDVENGLVYVGTTKHGMQIIDVWHAGGPVVVGNWSVGSAIGNLTVVGSRAYVQISTNIYIVDISNAAAPVVLGIYRDELFAITEIEVSGNLMFMPVVHMNCSAGSPGCETYLRIVDISNPAAPQLLASWTKNAAFIYDVALYSGYAYVVEYGTALHILDISNPASPVLTAQWSASPTATSASVSDGTLYVAVKDFGNGDSLRAYALTDPTAPQLLQQYVGDAFESDPHLYVSNHLTYFMSRSVSDIDIVSLLGTGSPVRLGGYTITYGLIHKVIVQDPYVYTLANSVLYILSSQLPFNPTPVGRLQSPRLYSDLAVDDSYAYALSSRRTIDAIDLTNPASPQVVGAWTGDELTAIDRIYTLGDLLFGLGPFGLGLSKLYVFDISNRTQPTLAGMLQVENATSLFFHAGYVYVVPYSSGGTPLPIVDVSTPSNPQVVGYFAPGFSVNFAFNGSSLFTAGYYSVSLFDMTNPLTPDYLASLSLGQSMPVSIAQQGDTLFVLTYDGIQIWDVGTVNSSVPVGYENLLDVSTGAWGNLSVSGDRLFLITDNNGFYVMQIHSATATESLYLPFLVDWR